MRLAWIKISCVVYFQDGSNLPSSQRAYHPEELAKADNLTVGMYIWGKRGNFQCQKLIFNKYLNV